MKIDIQGHRGCRGNYPENSIPGFLHAIDIGVDTLEMDVVVSKDGLTILSHEPFMSHEIAMTPEGHLITKDEEEGHNLYNMTYQEIKTYDTGSRVHPRFVDQLSLVTHKPSLIDMAMAVKAKLDLLGLESINYNIEIKRKPKWEETNHHPDYMTFADIVIRDIKQAGILPNTTVQCFDIPTLQYLNETYPEVRTVYLIENKNSPEENLKMLGFIPTVYSPDFCLVDNHLIQFCKENNMLLVPWTINKRSDIEHMIALNVDGIISDYPSRVINLVKLHNAL